MKKIIILLLTILTTVACSNNEERRPLTDKEISNFTKDMEIQLPPHTTMLFTEYYEVHETKNYNFRTLIFTAPTTEVNTMLNQAHYTEKEKKPKALIKPPCFEQWIDNKELNSYAGHTLTCKDIDIYHDPRIKNKSKDDFPLRGNKITRIDILVIGAQISPTTTLIKIKYAYP